MEDLNSFTAISPVDGRYRTKTKVLAPYFSEMGLVRYRLLVEVEYFISLCEIPLNHLRDFPESSINALRKIYENFSADDMARIKHIEAETNHDIKAVEYFLREKWDFLEIGKYKEFIHFGLTSQDVNNTAVPLSLKDAFKKVLEPKLLTIVENIQERVKEWMKIPMLAHTHGQPASPTVLGKEFSVFTNRLSKQIQSFSKLDFYGKFGGATGNFNAHVVAYPNHNWESFGNKFLEKLGLKRNQITTQIDHYDDLAAIFDNLRRINVILVDQCRDIWTYISMQYFTQKTVKNEVGSSAMPHKVNPIDFENAEGNLLYANAILDFMSNKLPVSRLQRDLTDSTVLRNIGIPIAHSLIAYESILKGLGKLSVNESKISADLDDNWAVVAEAIQTILRRENYPDPYNALKSLTRGQGKITKESIQQFIDSLSVNGDIKVELMRLTPANYTGIYKSSE